MAATIKSRKEIETLKEGGKILAEILVKVIQAARSGISTLDLDTLAERLIKEEGGVPSFKGYRIRGVRTPYPGSICVSVNDEVVHSIPRHDKILKEGDVVGLDIGMAWPSYGSVRPMFTDMAVTVGIGKISFAAKRLIRATKEALDAGIAVVRPGAKVGDVSYAIQARLEKDDLGIIRDLAGHGVGYAVHEEPLVPNYGIKGSGIELKEGMVLAIEPMATLGGWRVVLQDDEWTFKTADRSLAAHFEHTIAVTAGGEKILTSF